MLSDPYIRIAIISDLHCQKEENSSKLTRLHTKLLDHPINENPVESFKKIIIDKKKEVDYFFVLGDVADKGNVEGFILGMKFIKEINTLLDAKKLIFAVGNHDMHRRKENDTIQDSEYMMKLTNGFPFLFKENDQSEEIENYFWANKYCVIEDDKTLILALNTSCYMDKVNDQKPFVFDQAMQESLEKKLSDYNSSKKIKIAVCHHHPTQHSDIDAKYTSLDCIDRGDKLLELLIKNNFTLLMHGHKHFPRLKYDDNFPIFCSGSFSSLENTSSFNEDNTIHFLDIYQEGTIFKGIIETWIYNTRDGWKKSSDLKSRFPIYTGFGSKMEVENIAESIYENFYKKYEDLDSNEKYLQIDMENVSEKVSDINFLTPSQLKQLESELEKKNLTINIDTKGKRRLCMNY